MSTVVASHHGESQSGDSSDSREGDSEIGQLESEHAMARARQRASLFVCHAAPRSLPTSAATSPTAKQSSKHLWNKEGCPRVKSSLKLHPGLQRSNSEPSHKTVHFSTTNLVNVRQFRGTQKPSAVGRTDRTYSIMRSKHYGGSEMFYEDVLSSAGTDDEDEDEGEDCEDEDDFSNDTDEKCDRGKSLHGLSRFKSITARVVKLASRNTQEWTLLTPGFVPHAFSRVHGPQRPICYVETLQLSTSPSSLNAAIYVRNVSFHKYVALRYTINEWVTFSETQGIYSSDVRKFDRDAGYDRFVVSIPLNAFPSSSLNTSVLKFCVHYIANESEFWDNNGGKNYEVYLRNPRFASAPQTGSNSHAMQQVSEGLDVRSRCDFEPQIVISDDEGSEGKRCDSISSTDFLRKAGIQLRSPQEAKLRDPFFNRYSFESALSFSPKSPREYSNAPVFAIKGDQIVAESKIKERSQPSRVNRSQDFKSGASADHKKVNQLGSGSASVLTLSRTAAQEEIKGQATDPHAWESDKYKDFVSKYCFYTPGNRELSPAEKEETPSEPAKFSNHPAKNALHPATDHVGTATISRTTI